MKRFTMAAVLALVLALGAATIASAAGPGQAAGTFAGQQHLVYGYGEFIDLDGDGVCDRVGSATPVLDGTGSQWGQGNTNAPAGGIGAGVPVQDGAGWQAQQGGNNWQASQPGLGVPVQDGTGVQARQNGRWGR